MLQVTPYSRHIKRYEKTCSRKHLSIFNLVLVNFVFATKTFFAQNIYKHLKHRSYLANPLGNAGLESSKAESCIDDILES